MRQRNARAGVWHNQKVKTVIEGWPVELIGALEQSGHKDWLCRSRIRSPAMDSISMVAASVHLVGSCAKLSGYVYTFIQKSQTVDTIIRVLDIKITSLSQVLGSIATSCSDPLMASAFLESQTGHEGQY